LKTDILECYRGEVEDFMFDADEDMRDQATFLRKRDEKMREIA